MNFQSGHALLVGVGQYQNTRLNVPVTVRDAEDFGNLLRDPALAGYPANQVTTLVNQDATRSNILDELGKLATRCDANSNVIIYLCGHGIIQPNSQNYCFLTHDSRKRNDYYDSGTVISQEDLQNAIQAIKVRKLLVIFNTCFSGGASDSLDASESLDDTTSPPDSVLEGLLKTGEGRYMVTACRADQVSSFSLKGQHTYFMEYFLEGLTGAAELGRNLGYIGLFELYDYVFARLQKLTNIKQQPTITIKQGVGPFAVALYKGGGSRDGSLGDAEKALASLPQVNNPDAVRVITINANNNTGQQHFGTGDNVRIEKGDYIKGNRISTGGGAYIAGNVSNSGGINLYGGRVGNINYNDTRKPAAKSHLDNLLEHLQNQINALADPTIKGKTQKAFTLFKGEIDSSRQDGEYELNEVVLDGAAAQFKKAGSQIYSTARAILQQPDLSPQFKEIARNWS